MDDVYLLLGGNLGNREKNLLTAIYLIAERVGAVIQQSLVYESAAWGNTNQPDFLNQALICNTSLTPHQVLTEINFIENTFGRDRTEKWGARTMDIDILFYANQIINDNHLTIPHPLLQDRRFVLTPLNEIATAYVHPILNKNIAQLYQECADESKVWKFEAEENTRKHLQEEFSFSMDYLTKVAQGDKGFINKMVAVYAAQTPLSIAILSKAITENDFETTAHIAHKMKPTFLMFKVNSISEALAAIEKDASQNTNMPNIAKMFELMLPVIDKVYEKWNEGRI